MTTKRTVEISRINLAFCAMVICIHLLSDAVTHPGLSEGQYVLLYTVQKLCSPAVYGFLFLAALKIFRKGFGPSFRYASYYKSRFLRIVVPYAVALAAYMLIYSLLPGYSWPISSYPLYLLSGAFASHFYFVPVIVQFYVLLPLWRLLVEKGRAAVVLPLALFFQLVVPEATRVFLLAVGSSYVPHHFYQLFVPYTFFWLAGAYAGKEYDRFTAALRRFKSLWLAVWCAAILGVAGFAVLLYRGIYMEYLSFMQTALSAVTILLLYERSLALEQCKPQLSRLGAALDRASYEIYLYHMLFVVCGSELARRLGLLAMIPAFFVRTAVTLCGTAAALVVLNGCKRLLAAVFCKKE